jgi:hypothetical protein
LLKASRLICENGLLAGLLTRAAVDRIDIAGGDVIDSIVSGDFSGDLDRSRWIASA